MIRPFAVVAVAALVASLPSQEVRADRVREVLAFLSSDRLAGRDSPSAGLDEAARFLAEGFERAGLKPGVGADEDAGWFHEYTLPGMRFATGDASVTLISGTEKVPLKPDADFRIWENGRAFAADGVALVEEPADADADPRVQRRNMAGRTIRFLTVDVEDSAWQAAAGGRAVVRGRAAGSAPIVLLRRDAVPEGATTADVTVPEPTAFDVPLSNVVAVLPGTDLADEYVLVSAHYDHIGLRPRVDGADGVFNGADDDATGTTAVLTLAEHFATIEPRLRRSLMFVCFSAEEKGLRGSRAFCAKPPVPLEKIAVVLNLEMLGRPEPDRKPYAWITGADLSDFAAIAQPAFASRRVELAEFAMASRLFFASDNLPFAEQGVVAHSISAGTLHEDYHQPGDQIERIAVDHMTAVIGGIAALVTEFATRDERPVYTEAALKRLRR